MRGETPGSAIKAWRLGFGWCAPIGAYVRLSDHPHGFRVDVCDAEHLTSRKWPEARGGELHIAWWTAEAPQWVASLVAPGLEYLGPDPAEVPKTSFVIDDDGAIVHRVA